jgi:hypothetical protein
VKPEPLGRSAEFNAELERARRIEAGHPEEREPHAEPRDTATMSIRPTSN